MNDWESIQALMEKHAPKRNPKLPDAGEIRRAYIKMWMREGVKTPQHVVDRLYSDYLKVRSTWKVAKRFGLQRNTVRNIFKRHNLLFTKNQGPIFFHNGIKYSAKKGENIFRRTKRGEQKYSLNRDVWEAAYGPLKPGQLIVNLSGNPQNTDPTKLMLTDRNGLMKHIVAVRMKK